MKYFVYRRFRSRVCGGLLKLPNMRSRSKPSEDDRARTIYSLLIENMLTYHNLKYSFLGTSRLLRPREVSGLEADEGTILKPAPFWGLILP